MIESTKSNPFCSRFLQPGNIPFCFPGTESISQLADRIRSPLGNKANLGNKAHPGKKAYAALRLSIVGPHGSGKSTLLHQLWQELRGERQGNRISDSGLVVLHSSSNKLAALRSIRKQIHRDPWCLIDGYEQIPRWAQLLIVAWAKPRRVALCVTAHRLPWMFQTLWETKVDAQVESYVIESLLANVAAKDGRPASVISDLLQSSHWTASRQKHKENLRESLFDMYDWWQATVDDFPRSR
jgi:hypothetical protein